MSDLKKVEAEHLAYVLNAIKVAQLVNIDSVIIEQNCVRGIDENRTVFILETDNVGKFELGDIALSRTNDLTARYDIAKTQKDFTVLADIVQSDDTNFVRSLLLKAKGIKIDYRCCNPNTITAPKQYNDQLAVEINVNSDAVLLLQKGIAAMGGCEHVTVQSDDSKVSFKLNDVNKDVFEHTFTEQVKLLNDDADINFKHKYSAKALMALLKHNPEGSFSISSKGLLRFPINQIHVFLLPQVD